MRKLSLNHAAFDTLTPESRYWAGFLMADGCLTLAKRRRKSGKIVFYRMIAVNVAVRDKRHLHKFRSFMGSEHAVTVYKYRTSFGPTKQARIAFISSPVWEKLVALGIVPRKTKGCQAAPTLERDRDFWRGMIDGDGCISTSAPRGVPWTTIQLDGCRPLLQQFQSYVKSVTGTTYKVAKHPRIKRFGRLKLGGCPASKLMKTLYAGASTSLDRKQKLAVNNLQ